MLPSQIYFFAVAMALLAIAVLINCQSYAGRRLGRGWTCPALSGHGNVLRAPGTATLTKETQNTASQASTQRVSRVRLPDSDRATTEGEEE
jgi:hypothetical protein